MKIELKDFQQTYVGKLLDEARFARFEVANGGKPQALVLASPTGSGKTMIATAFIERLIAGVDEHPPDPEATFLWISYQPDLNEQTRRKMIETSSLLGSDELTIVGSDFKAERFAPGKVHFVNAQKLGRDKQLVTSGDKGSATFWDTIRNTAEHARESFWVIIDEAHKGMQGEGAGAESIMQKFLLGSKGEIPPVDLVLGISATPQRFDKLLAAPAAKGKPERNRRPVTVPPEEVRESGLLKDRVTLHHPEQAGAPAEMTLLAEAAGMLARFDEEWAAYSAATDQPGVHPLLVVQVVDAKAKQPSGTDLAAVRAAIEERIGELDPKQIAHAFQEGAPIEAGGRSIRYVRPADIEADTELRVVLFKQSLNTGWDCPRAEVMMSFRRAVDRTHIAQLIGRMVRTPLARRIESTEFLNSVCLYLPRFDAKAVQDVVAYLTDPESEDSVPIEVVPAAEIVELDRIDAPSLVDGYQALPSFTIPRPRSWTNRRRLLKLGRALAHDGIDQAADDEAQEFILAALATQHDARRNQKAFKQAVSEKRSLRLRSIDVHYATDATEEHEAEALALTSQSVNAIFDLAGRKLGDGIHLSYFKQRAAADKQQPDEIKLELACLLDDAAALGALEAATADEVKRLMGAHRDARKALPPDRREAYAEILGRSREPERIELALPQSIQIRKGSGSLARHLFVDAEGGYPGTLNTWEKRVIEAELARADVIGWLRNVDRKPWALCVPYEYEERRRGLYPDLIVFREDAGGIVVDVLDPHRHDLDDAWVKAKGLARYAVDFGGDHLGRIEAIAVEPDGSIRRIELHEESWRKKVLAVSSNAHLKDIYDQVT